MLPDACFRNQWGTPHARGISEERRCGICWRILHLYYTVYSREKGPHSPPAFKPESPCDSSNGERAAHNAATCPPLRSSAPHARDTSRARIVGSIKTARGDRPFKGREKAPTADSSAATGVCARTPRAMP